VKGLKNNKAAGPDGLPAEVFKHGGYLLKHRLHRFITSTWSSGCVPQQWKDSNIVTIYKRKGDKAICGNSRGISLLLVAVFGVGAVLSTWCLSPVYYVKKWSTRSWRPSSLYVPNMKQISLFVQKL